MITHAPEVCSKDTRDKISLVHGSLRNDLSRTFSHKLFSRYHGIIGDRNMHLLSVFALHYYGSTHDRMPRGSVGQCAL